MSVVKTATVNRLHVQLVLNDPEFIEDIKKGLGPVELKKLYGFSPEDTLVNMDQYKLLKEGFAPFTGGWIKQDEPSGEFNVLLHTDIKKHQLEELWGYIQRTRETNSLVDSSKTKPPEDPELLYAVFKARARGKTFPQIFNMYQTETLASYTKKPKSNFSTEFEIKKYYSKYYNPL